MAPCKSVPRTVRPRLMKTASGRGRSRIRDAEICESISYLDGFSNCRVAFELCCARWCARDLGCPVAALALLKFLLLPPPQKIANGKQSGCEDPRTFFEIIEQAGEFIGEGVA